MPQEFRPYRGKVTGTRSGYIVRDLDGVVLCRIEYYDISMSELCTVGGDWGGNFIAGSLRRFGINPHVVLMSPFQCYSRV